MPFTTQTLTHIAYEATQQVLQLSWLHEHEAQRLLFVHSRHLLPYCSLAVQLKLLARVAVCAHTVVLLVCVTHE